MATLHQVTIGAHSMAAPVGEETPRVVDWIEPDGQPILGTPRQLAVAIRTALTARLCDTTLVVGPRGAGVGTAFTGATFSSQFTTSLYAHTDIDRRKGRLVYSRALVDAVSTGLADAVVSAHLRFLGILAIPTSVPLGDGVQVDNSFVALRLTVAFDMRKNTHVVWVNLLGAP
ncbi:MAG TPA: hypothetical protein VMR92_08485 [Gemmatimonadales bacterium]|nr:hypothetical protein [Gemmatimonadales bacterium]